MKKLTLTLLAMVFAASPMRAGDDFGARLNLEAQKKFTRTLGMDFEVGLRQEDNLSSFCRYDFGVGLTYKPFKFLKFGAAYTFIRSREPEEAKVNFTQKGKLNGWNVDHPFWRSRHRASFDVTGAVKLGRFKVSLRERFQFTENMAKDILRDRYRDLADAAQAAAHPDEVFTYRGEPYWERETVERRKHHAQKYYLRSRLAVEYNIRHCKWTPFASFELSNNLENGFSADKKRVQVGAEWSVTKRHGLSFAYLFQTGDDDDDTGDLHALCVGYSFSF